MIYGFSRPPCPQCGETEDNIGDMTDAHGFVAIQPMFIMREATMQEWLAQYKQEKATLGLIPCGHFYEVSTD